MKIAKACKIIADWNKKNPSETAEGSAIRSLAEEISQTFDTRKNYSEYKGIAECSLICHFLHVNLIFSKRLLQRM